FKGQTFNLNEQGNIHGNLSLPAQLVVIKGSVKDNITGQCQTLVIPEDFQGHVNLIYGSVTYTNY
ncbi:hypothetical protein JW877_09025, partial [bacterium]|nr:hypothetical protein [bacterium]